MIMEITIQYTLIMNMLASQILMLFYRSILLMEILFNQILQ